MKIVFFLRTLLILLVLILAQANLSSCGGGGGTTVSEVTTESPAPDTGETNEESPDTEKDEDSNSGSTADEEGTTEITEEESNKNGESSETDVTYQPPEDIEYIDAIVLEDVIIKQILTQEGQFAEVTETEVYTLQDGTPIEAAKDEILVFLSEEISYEQLKTIIKQIIKLGGEIVGYDKDLLTLQVRTTKEYELMNALKDLEGVYHVSFNLVVDFESSSSIALEPLEEKDVCLLPKIPSSWWIDAINLVDAWKITRGSNDVVIGIVDSGIPAGQEILDESRLRRFDAQGNELSDDDTWNLESFKYSHHHGLWVTGFAAGFRDDPDNCDNELKGKNVRGVNHFSNALMIDVARVNEECIKDEQCTLKVVWTGSASGIKTAIRKEAQVINISLGPPTKRCDNDECKLRVRKEWRKNIIGAGSQIC